MLVYGTQGTKVTETFTGSRFARRTLRTACWSIAEPKNLGAKRNELDDEIALDYFGARYLDPMLGLWTSVDPKRQYLNPYLYAGSNPIMRVDPDGNMAVLKAEGQVAKYTLVAASVLDPEPVTRNMANAATVALDAIEGYCENGGKGAAVAGTIDLMTLEVGKFFPDNIKNRLGQAIFYNAAGGAELCVSVVGCSFGVPIMLAGFLDVNLVKLRLIFFLLNRN